MNLAGHRVLVAVDNHFVAADVRQAVVSGGGSIVGSTATSAGALRLIKRRLPSAAVISAVLENQTSGPVADRLTELSIPFVLVTNLAPQEFLLSIWNAVYVIRPFAGEELIKILAAAIAAGRPCRRESKSDAPDLFEASSMRLS